MKHTSQITLWMGEWDSPEWVSGWRGGELHWVSHIRCQRGVNLSQQLGDGHRGQWGECARAGEGGSCTLEDREWGLQHAEVSWVSSGTWASGMGTRICPKHSLCWTFSPSSCIKSWSWPTCCINAVGLVSVHVKSSEMPSGRRFACCCLIPGNRCSSGWTPHPNLPFRVEPVRSSSKECFQV